MNQITKLLQLYQEKLTKRNKQTKALRKEIDSLRRIAGRNKSYPEKPYYLNSK